ncbi:NAD(P)-binding domain-containing protein [Dictyobacter aurantiacus]|uniref:FAD dependent oxidoreductase domain-containing protein n=1 Tax=Dictyobacter aurantiacus TaxID=1936993 RepID=A0A401Z9Q4_9CHLR|nr:NAD(P)-binding domain-containing protein [Dictyobacter aurantiacus]GCE03543.1 hypothetical protein KDAU_08720 [Dictyobacter aurantiacus]
MTVHTTHPIVIIGAGPVGLAAAAHALRNGETPLVFEAGASAGAAIQQWGHVRLFSPWRYLVDIEAQTLLRETSWTMPEPEGYPTGQQFLEAYITPLAQTSQLAPCIRWNTHL